MAKLYFDVEANYEEVTKLTQEVSKLEKQLVQANASTNPAQLKAWQSELAASRTRLAELVASSAMAGAELRKMLTNFDTHQMTAAFAQLRSEVDNLPIDGATRFGSAVSRSVKSINRAIKDNEKQLKNYQNELKKFQVQYQEAFARGDKQGMDTASAAITNTIAKIRDLTNETTKYKNALNVLKPSEEQMTKAEENQAGVMVKLLGGQKSYNAILNALPAGMKNVVSGINGMTKAAWAFIKTPLGLALAALLAAFAALKTYLTGAVGGQEKLAQVTGALKGVMYALRNVVIDVGEAMAKFGEKAFNAFKKPKEAMDSFVNGIAEKGKKIGSFFQLLLGDKEERQQAWDMLKEAATEATDAVKKGAENAKQGIKDLADEAKAASKEMSAIEKAKFNLKKRESEWSIQAAALNARKSELQGVMYDSNLNPEERKKAYEETVDIIHKLKSAELGFISERISLQKREMALSTNPLEAEMELNSLLAQRNEIQGRYAGEESALMRRKNGIVSATIRDEKKLLSFEREIQQEEINLMNEGSAKKLKNIDLAYQKELDKIRQSKEEWERENHGNLTDEQATLINDRTILAEKKRLKDIKDLEDEFRLNYLKEYGSFREKEAAIDEEYDKKIDASSNYHEKKTLERQRQSALLDLAMKEGEVYKQIFGDVTAMSKDALNATIDMAEEEFRRVIASGEFTAESIKALRDQIDKLKAERDNIDFSGWGGTLVGVVKSLKEKGRRDKAYTEAQAATEAESHKIDANYNEYKKLKKAEDDAAEAAKRATEEFKKQAAALAATQLGSLLSRVGDGLREIADISGNERLGNLAEGFEKVGGAVSNIANGFASGGVIGGIAAALNVVTDSIMSMVTSIGVANAKYEKFLKDFATQQELMKLAIKDENYENIFGTDGYQKAIDAFGKVGEALKKYQDKSKELMNMWVKTKDYSWFLNQSGLKMDKYENLGSFDIWTDGYLDVDKAEVFLNTAQFITDEQREQIELAIEYKNAYDDALSVVRDYVSSLVDGGVTTIADEMLSKFLATGSAIVDMNDNLDDFKKNLAKSMVQSMLLEKVFTQTAQDEISGMIATGDVQGAISAYQDLLNSANEYSGDIEQFLAGLNIEDLSAQSATAGGFKTMSQETANELNGRFTALQITGEQILSQNTLMSENFNDLMQMFGNQILIADDVRNIQAQALIELQGINENTGGMVNPMKEMREDIAAIRKLVKEL